MIYRLLGRLGAIKNCYKHEAQQLIESDAWVDITTYKTEEKRNENESILSNEATESKKSGHKSDQRKRTGVQCSGNPKTNGTPDINTRSSSKRQEKDEVLKSESSEMPRPKRRGRPPKIKVSNNAADCKNSK